MFETERYAFGADYRDGAACPVLAATGSDPRDEWLTLAGMYDAILREDRRERQGTVSEIEAKEAWFGVIRNLEDRLEIVEEGAPTRVTGKQLRKARKVADELGWD